MKILPYKEAPATYFDNEKAKGVAARVVIGIQDGAEHFCMRVFEIAVGGNTPRHSHDWEHEIFVHAGEGEVLSGDRWHSVKSGSVVFIPSNEDHQLRNVGTNPFTFVCLIPTKAPEL